MRYIKFLGNDEYPIPGKKKEETSKSDLLKVKDILNKAGYTLNLHLYAMGMEAWMEGTNSAGKVKAIILSKLQVNTYAGLPDIYGNQLISSATLFDNSAPTIDTWRAVDSIESFTVENPLSFVGEKVYLHPFILLSYRFPNITKTNYELETLYAENFNDELAYIWPYEDEKVYTFSAHKDNKKFIVDSINSTEGVIYDLDLLIPKDIFSNIISGVEGITVIN